MAKRSVPAAPDLPAFQSERQVDGPVPDALKREIEELYGLTDYEARVLLALMRVGTGTTIDLARLSRVHRSAIYPVLEALHVKGLAERLPGDGPARWVAAPREVAAARLEAGPRTALEEQLHEYQERSQRVRHLILEAFQEAPAVARPHVHVLHLSSHVKQAYDQMVANARNELVMFTRPPYATRSGYVNPRVLAMLSRGVKTRVVYQAGDDDDPAFVTYSQHGVEARVVPELGFKLSVVDRSVALVSMTDPAQAGYPTTILIEHPAYAASHALMFEQIWMIGLTYAPNGLPRTQRHPSG